MVKISTMLLACFISAVVGSVVGIFAIAVCRAAGKADKRMENLEVKENELKTESN